jgi:hypothetical protein
MLGSVASEGNSIGALFKAVRLLIRIGLFEALQVEDLHTHQIQNHKSTPESVIRSIIGKSAEN